jgi:hypothetical protein
MSSIAFRNNISLSLRLRNFLIFGFVFVIFFLYQRVFVYQSLPLFYFANTLFLIVFLISVFKIKFGVYTFIFFIPLLNSLATMLGIRSTNILLFLFFSLLLGFIVNKSSEFYENSRSFYIPWSNKNSSKIINYNGNTFFDVEILKPIVLFIIIITLSAIITIFRYSNFLPFLSSNYHNLIINIDGVKSTSSIYWTIGFFFNYIIGFLLFFVLFNVIEDGKEIIRIIIAVIFSNIIVIIFGFYQYFFNPYIGTFSQWVEAGRINSTFTDPNSLGNYVVLLFPLFFTLIIFFKKWYIKILSLILLLAFTTIALFSGSRNALIGVALTILIFLVVGIYKIIKILRAKIKYPRPKINLNVLTFFIIVLILMIVIMTLLSSCLNFQGIDEKYKPKTNIASIDRMVDTIWMAINNFSISRSFTEAFRSVSSYRHLLWRQALNMFKDYPLTGVGLGAFIIELPNYYEKTNSEIRHVDYSGNYYLQILSELGLIGLFLILFIFFLVIKKAVIYYRNMKKLKKFSSDDWLLGGFFISFMSMVLILFFGPHTNFNEIQFTFWLIIGLIFSYIRIKENNIINEAVTESINNAVGFKADDFRPGEPAFPVIKKIFNKKSVILTDRIHFNLGQSISFIAIILIFSVLFFTNSWCKLSINKERIVYGWENNHGFYKEEKYEGKIIRWTEIDASEVMTMESSKMLVQVKSITPGIEKLPLFIRFFSDNTLVKILVLKDTEWHDVLLEMPYTGRNKFAFTISSSRDWVPKEWHINNDTRNLGVMVGDIKFLK